MRLRPPPEPASTKTASPDVGERPSWLERDRRTPRGVQSASCPPGWLLCASPPSTRHRKRNAPQTPPSQLRSAHRASIGQQPEFESLLYVPSLPSHPKVKWVAIPFH